MEHLKQYILTVVAAAVVCGLVLGLTGKRGTMGAVTKLLCGLFLSVTVISPFLGSELLDFSSYEDFWRTEADYHASYGVQTAAQSTREIIKDDCEAYILDKAISLGADIQVQITLSPDDPPVPQEITVTGSASPYARQALKRIIKEDMGISEENQQWI